MFNSYIVYFGLLYTFGLTKNLLKKKEIDSGQSASNYKKTFKITARNVNDNLTKKIKVNEQYQKYKNLYRFWVKSTYIVKRISQWKPCTDSCKKKTWLQNDGKAFKCWLCQKYPSTADGSNRLKIGTDIYYKNYITRYLSRQYESSVQK